jgi:acyl-CoA reductase-like NAD-dependent aldehyde dehydrogenase
MARRKSMSNEWPLYLAGRWEKSPDPLPVTSPYDDTLVGTTYLASAEQLEEATAAAQKAFKTTSRLASFEREEILLSISRGIAERREELARLMAREAGKPVRDTAVEITRAVNTFKVAAEEAKRIGGEVIPIDWLPLGKGRLGITRRFPIGPVAAISPFNFPLNLAAHKIAPAIAAGNPVVVKPPSDAPLVLLTVARIVHESGLPAGGFSVLPMTRTLGDRLVSDDRFKLLTFTGSSPVGWGMKERAGKKRVVLELGGNGGVIVDRDADLPYAVQRVAAGAFSFAGQVCISVQRVFIHEEVYDAFSRALVDAVKRLKVGDPLDPETDVGPVIDDASAERIQSWIEEAVQAGGRVLVGGGRQGRLFEPTVLADASTACKICSIEAFAPIVNVYSFHDFEEALARVNESAYGLQAGVFTSSLDHALRAFEELEVGGVMINDVSTFRIDHMPFGGTKDSGFGREGVKYAIEDQTEIRLMVFNRP